MDSISTLEQRRKQAEEILKSIEKEFKESLKYKEEFKKELIKLKSENAEHNKLVTSINKTLKTSEESRKALLSEKRKVSTTLTTVKNFYEKRFTPLKNEILDPINGLKATIKSSKRFLEELSKNNTDTKKQISDIKTNLVQIRQISRSAQTSSKTIEKLEQGVNKNSERVNKIKSESEIVLKDITSVQSRIKKIGSDIDGKKKDIDKNLTDSTQALNQITNLKKESNENLDKIKNIYQIAAETGLGGEFDKRKKSLKDELEKWQRHLFGTTIVLLSVVLILFVFQLYPEFKYSSIDFDANFYVRFLITSPIVFYLFFATNQYNKARSLHEKYSFKTAIALSIDAHINLLTGIEELKGTEVFENRLTNFIFDGFAKIHSEPFNKEESSKVASGKQKKRSSSKNLEPSLISED